MHRTFMRYLNDSVFRGPENEGGGGDAVQDLADTGSDGGAGGGDVSGGDVSGQGSEAPQEKLTVREQIKASMAEVAAEPQPPKKAKDKAGRFTGEPKPADGVAKPADAAAAPAAPAAPAEPEIPAPDSLSKEAKEAWKEASPAIKAAFIKREQDMANGVQALQQRYALIDQALHSHTDALRQMNATPGEAVNRMFLWFKALAGKPADAFPALAQSMGLDWSKLIAAKAGAPDAQAAAQGAGGGTAPEIPEPVRQYVGQLEGQVQQLIQHVNQLGGRFGSVEQNINTQNQHRTNENLNFWAKDKEFFQEVRQEMGKLIETGVIPLKDGQVDLDSAYESAIYLNPTVRAKVLAAQQQANQAVQQQARDAATTAQRTQVDRSRRAAVSLPAASTPGSLNGAPAAKKKNGPTSVRDSLRDAISTLRDQ